jgi:hypothetical protein
MTVKEIDKINKIGAEEFDRISRILFDSFKISSTDFPNVELKSKQLNNLSKKEELIISYSSFLNKLLELKFVESKKSKLELIDFLDKLNLQRELLEIAQGQLTFSDVNKNAKRLGKKSQSAFKSK